MTAVSQKNLAFELGITDRRVRQLIEEKILPEPNVGGYDIEKCRSRYNLYAHGDKTSWAEFEFKMLDDSHRVEALMSKALKAKAKRKDLATCAQAHIALFDDLRFAIAAQGKSRPEHALVMRLIDYEERASFARLWERSTRFIQDHPDWAA